MTLDPADLDRVASRCAVSGIPLTRAGIIAVAGYLDDARAGEAQPDSSAGGRESAIKYQQHGHGSYDQVGAE